MDSQEVGFVYVLVNAAMPGMVKIGQTSLLSEDRARKLFGTGLPVPFEVAFRVLTARPAELERAAHAALAPCRVASNREFFNIGAEEAAEAIVKVQQGVDGIAAWAPHPVRRVRSRERLVLSLRAGQIFVVLARQGIWSPMEVFDLWQAHSDGDILEINGHDASYRSVSLSDGDVDLSDPVPYLNREHSARNVEPILLERLVSGERLVWIDRPDADGVCASQVFEATDDCQVVGRTRNPQLHEGRPLLLNHVIGQPAPGMGDALRKALALPEPRVWSKRPEPSSWQVVYPRAAPSHYWLPQLASRDRRRGHNA
ncbi:GIY-YIG nuclease family protein [Micromonospora sp. WMMD1274]|uniref:GIY-YIG nuclease family protein n=1 Tax=Micromonospora sp. WMMD1274 TaxID=3404116 RepID=UPI003B94826F